jgi:UDP-N-acetylmuramate dehydrogenase
MMAAQHTQRWRGELRYNEPMARHTSWRAGGPARRFYKPADLADLCVFLQDLDPDEPLLWVGLGSNLLVRDGGFRGTVIYTFGALTALDWLDDKTLRVEAGVSCARVARETTRRGVPGGHSRHHGRCTGHECRCLWRRDLAPGHHCRNH